VASLLAALPLGTKALRAGLGAALVAGLAGATVFSLARRLLAACAPTRRLGAVVASIAAIACVAAPAWQLESATAGGSAAGAVVALVPLALLARDANGSGPVAWPAVALALGLAFAHEPLVGLCALGACAVLTAFSTRLRRGLVAAVSTQASALTAGAALGLSPLWLALVRARGSGAPLLPLIAESWGGEQGTSRGGSPLPFVREDIGWLVMTLAAVGVALAVLLPRARPLAAALVALVLLGLGCGWLGCPHGPSRFGAPLLDAWAAASAMGAVSMQALVRAVAGARLPFARASAAMVLLLELALPVDSADASLLSAHESLATPVWDDVAWGELPPRTVVLLTSPGLDERARAARFRGALREDIELIPAYAKGPSPRRALAVAPSLLPLWRDLEFVGAPSEAALSALAAARPLAMVYEPRWGPALGRHLVPAALLDMFQLEPRGRSDRRYALDAFARERSRLATFAANDPELAAVSASLLRARSLAVASSGDRELLPRVVDDARSFAAKDPVLDEIVARSALGKAATFDDLRP
jgi:hypothetical protein